MPKHSLLPSTKIGSTRQVLPAPLGSGILTNAQHTEDHLVCALPRQDLDVQP